MKATEKQNTNCASMPKRRCSKALPFSIFNFQFSTPLAECTGQSSDYYQMGDKRLEGILSVIGEDNTERDLYFYHSDHLGSSSFISDASGTAIQHLQYLPFGETFVDQRNSSYNTPYKFSAKEKDDETGYSYFGARYYWPEVSVWLSVDPLSDKYPSMSAYMYCAGNPVILVDPAFIGTRN
jgi:RHS repeat-associated protein